MGLRYNLVAMEDKRLDATRQLLERGVRFLLPAPFWLRWLKPRLTIKAHKGGTIFLFSEIVLEHNFEKLIAEDDDINLLKNIKYIVECLAISALNGYWKIKLFKNILSKYLLWYVNKYALIEMFVIVFNLNNSKDFTTITKFYLQQTKMMLNPNLGQEKMGS